jgi:16S rRNA (uracil1498-N3)-methyltransferase
MTRLYCPLPITLEAEFELPEAAARHAQVLRLQPGDPLDLFDGHGGAWRGVITAMGRSSVRSRALATRALSPRASRAITLAVGMPANERMDWLVEKATELGVARIVPLITQRTVVRLSGERALKRQAHWQAIAAGACEQCGRDDMPAIEPITPWSDWLRATPTLPPQTQRLRLSLGPDARHWSHWPLAASQALCAALGPEGGFSEDEEAALHAAGFAPVSLGPLVLRAETAALTVLARWADAAPSTTAPAP